MTKLSMDAIVREREAASLDDHIVPQQRTVVNREPAKTSAQVLKGLELLGLKGRLEKTGSPDWKRIYIYDWDYGRAKYEKEHGNQSRGYLGLYVGRIALHHDEVTNIKLHVGPSYYATAIYEMINSRRIVNHINYYSLGVKAYNETYEAIDSAKERVAMRKPGCKSALNKALQRFNKRFLELLRGQYVSTTWF